MATDFDSINTRDLNVLGTCNLPAGAIGNAQFEGAGSDALDADKVQQQFQPSFTQARGIASANGSGTLHVVRGTNGTLAQLFAKLITACGVGSTVTVAFFKGAVSLGSLAFTDADPANTVKTATPAVTSAVADDDINYTVTVAGAAPGQGITGGIKLREYAD